MQNNITKLAAIILLSLFVCINLSPKIVVENYGNWRTLSFSVKGAYITGVWDSLLIELAEIQDNQKKNSTFLTCLLEKDFTIGDFVEKINFFYTLPEYKDFSPVTLLKEKILTRICSNKH